MNEKSIRQKMEDVVWEKAFLSGRQLLVILIIARGVDENGGRWSGYITNQLALPARASRGQIESDLKMLEGNKFIKIERSADFAHIWICDPEKWIKGEQAR